MDDLVTWLRAQLDQDELWALAASAPYHGDGPTVPGGLHWTWAVGENWDPVDVDPTVSYVGEPNDTISVSLVTREEFPLDWSPRGLNGKVLGAEEMRTGDGGHIVRWDPARVLAEVDAKRRILDLADDISGLDMSVDLDRRVGTRDMVAEPYAGEVLIKLLALPYAGRDGYREDWRP